MSKSVLLRYAYTCDSGDYVDSDWRDSDNGVPTQCSVNSAHDIVTDSIRVIERRDPNETSLVEEFTPTGGHYAYDTLAFDIPPDTVDHPYEKNWDDNINVMSISYITKDIHEGDEFKVLIGEDTDVGPIGSNISSGATSLVVASSASLPYLKTGFALKLSDGTNTDDVGYIRTVDSVTNTITFETATTNAFSAATPTKLLVTRIMVGRNSAVEIGPAWNHSVGKDKIGASYLPANTNVKILYTNKSLTVTKRFIINMYYMY